jgi:hypothetical protein
MEAKTVSCRAEDDDDFSKDITALEVLEVHSKTPFLNTLETFHIYKYKRTGLVFNEQLFDSYNPTFEIL